MPAAALCEALQPFGAEPEDRDKKFKADFGTGDDCGVGGTETYGKAYGRRSKDTAFGSAVSAAFGGNGNHNGSGADGVTVKHNIQEEIMRKEELKAFLAEEDGIGVIEVVLILVVLVGLVIIFKTQINKLLEAIFKEIEKQTKEVY